MKTQICLAIISSMVFATIATQVSSFAKQWTSDKSLPEATLGAGQASDYIFVHCNPAKQVESAVLKRNMDGTYSTFVSKPIESIQGLEAAYCSPNSDILKSGFNGKIGIISGNIWNTVNNVKQYRTLFFNINSDTGAFTYYEFTTGYAADLNYLDDYTLYIRVVPDGNSRFVVEYKDGQYVFTPTSLLKVTGQLTERYFVSGTSIYFLQPDYTLAPVYAPLNTTFWDYNYQADVLEQQSAYNAPSYNGFDTLLGYADTFEASTSGTVQVFEVDSNNLWTKKNGLTGYDYGQDNPYLVDVSANWAVGLGAPVWINKDLVLIGSPNFPTAYINGAKMSGSIAVLARQNGVWNLVGSLQPGQSVPVAASKFLRTKSDIVLVTQSSVNPSQSIFFSYPICFNRALSLTCKQDLVLNQCEQNSPPIDDAYSFTDDGCGEPQVSIQNVANMDGSTNKFKVDLRFERLGVFVGQCSAKVTCNTITAGMSPSSTTLSSSSSKVQIGGLVLTGFTLLSLF